MHVITGEPNSTRLMSTFLTRFGDESAYLVRIYPVVIGDGIVSLPQSRMVIGRDAGNGLVLADHDVSRQHAAIEPDGHGKFVVSDLGSTNGVIVNDQKVERATLAAGDLIRVGKTILKFLYGNGVERQFHETVYSMMINDGLTGIPNKRYFQEALARELTRSERHHRPLALAVLDIDHFKKINDTYGHLAGDAVLREVAARVRNAIRKDEVFARYGGEEFVVLLPEATLEQARLFGERIRTKVAGAPFETNGLKISVSISAGIGYTDGVNPMTAEELFATADGKLYQAKAAGRNRVVA